MQNVRYLYWLEDIYLDFPSIISFDICAFAGHADATSA